MNAGSIHDSAYSWLRLLITMAIAMVANVGMWAVVVVLPAIETEFGAGRAEASLPYTLTMVGFAVGNMVIGRIVDRFGVTLALAGAALAIALGYFLATVSPTIAVLSLSQLLPSRHGSRMLLPTWGAAAMSLCSSMVRRSCLMHLSLCPFLVARCIQSLASHTRNTSMYLESVIKRALLTSLPPVFHHCRRGNKPG